MVRVANGEARELGRDVLVLALRVREPERLAPVELGVGLVVAGVPAGARSDSERRRPVNFGGVELPAAPSRREGEMSARSRVYVNSGQTLVCSQTYCFSTAAPVSSTSQ